MKKLLSLHPETSKERNMEYTVIIEKNPETGIYVGQCKQIPEAISQGHTLEELLDNMKEAIELAIECHDNNHLEPATPPCSYTNEEMYGIVKERLQELEDGTAELIDGEEVLSKAREHYGFEAKLVK